MILGKKPLVKSDPTDVFGGFTVAPIKLTNLCECTTEYPRSMSPKIKNKCQLIKYCTNLYLHLKKSWIIVCSDHFIKGHLQFI